MNRRRYGRTQGSLPVIRRLDKEVYMKTRDFIEKEQYIQQMNFKGSARLNVALAK